MELRETCCLVDHSLIVKGNKLRNSRWWGIHRTGCVCVGGTQLHALRASLSPNLHVFLKPEAVQTLFGGFYGGVITPAQLIQSLAVVIASTRSASGFPKHGRGRLWGQRRDQKFQSSNHVLSYPGKQRPPLERRHSLKSHLIHLTRDTLTALPLR